ARDVRAAHAELAGRPGVDPDRLLYYGESLGAAVALDLAVERPPAGLVLRSPFASLADTARVHYPFVPAWLLRDRFDSVGRVRSLSAPLLVVVGENDDIVPAQTSRRLYALAAEPKRLVVVPGANHNDRALLDGDELIAAVVAFARDVAGR
ncbi:MAG: alpha/beta hydrolase, partial [Euzebyales bacterium]|nr:alpha/beta hydrolase [Euzebyales bacterium]